MPMYSGFVLVMVFDDTCDCLQASLCSGWFWHVVALLYGVWSSLVVVEGFW